MDNDNAAMAVLEEILERAIDECREANAAGNRERAMALFEVINDAKIQAGIAGLGPFSNRSLNDLDPYSLLYPVQRKAA